MNYAESKLTQLSERTRGAAVESWASHLEQLHLKFSFVPSNDDPQSSQYLGGVSRKAILYFSRAKQNDPTVPILHIR